MGLFAFYGIMGGMLNIEGIPIYPVRGDVWGRDVAYAHYRHFGADLLITHIDVWVYKDYFPRFVTEGKGRWLPVVPLDHDPMPPWIKETLTYAYKMVAISKFGQQQMLDEGFSPDRVTCIPKGANTEVLKPQPTDRSVLNTTVREQDRRNGVVYKPDDFVIGMVASNKGLRKEFARMFEGIRIFLENNPDARQDTKVFVHTDLEEPSGIRLDQLCKRWKLDKNIGFIDPYLNFLGLSEEVLAQEYNGFDVFMNVARGEGFGQPILESLACGVPVIVTDCTAMTELVRDSGGGELVRVKDKDMTHLMSYQFLPDPDDIADKIERLYNSQQLRDQYGRNGRKYAEKNSWEIIVREKWVPFLRQVQEELRGSVSPFTSMLSILPASEVHPLMVGSPEGGANTLL